MLGFKHQNNGAIEQISANNLHDLRISWGSSFDRPSLREHLEIFPGVSWYNKKTKEYLIGGYWRGRKEIGMLVEVMAENNQLSLVDHAIESFKDLGCKAVVLSHFEEEKDHRFYSGLGWHIFDEIITFERNGCENSYKAPYRLSLRTFTADQMPALLNLEMASFPWLWWSDADDFIRYANQYGVDVYTAWIDDSMIGYIGVTTLNLRGHLDRIAVDPKFQRNGFGEELLVRALKLFEECGVKRVSLNTQTTNYRSQSLYRKYGFRPVGDAHPIIGIWLQEPTAEEKRILSLS